MDLETLTSELQRCLAGWRAYEKDLVKAGLKGPLLATAVGWKVADLKEFSKVTQDLLTKSEQLHVGTVNDRFIGTFVLKEPLSVDDIRLIKVLQRRQGSDDALGLDHIDFYIEDIELAKTVLSDTQANWLEESNDVHTWLSIRFGEVLEYEAKFVDHTVLSAGIIELQQAEKAILN